MPVMAGARGAGAPPAATQDAQPIEGTIVVAPELAERVPAGATLFVIVRRGSGGPPTAVKRIEAPTFPLAFSIGPENRMIQTLPFEGPLQLTARLDTDGDAGTRLPGDLSGRLAGPVDPGAKALTLTLDEIL
jgi:cytochrome c-type biogenesis protein CcmH